MAALLTLAETELLGLSETDLLAMTLDGSSSGGSSSASCLWTEARIAAIETRLASIESALAKLATSAELISAQNAILAQCKTAVGFATPADVQITVNADGIEVPTSSEVASAVWNAGSRTLTGAGSSGLATASSLSVVKGLVQDVQTQQETMFALLARWSTSGNTLTVYASDGSTLGTFTLAKNANGDIVGVS